MSAQTLHDQTEDARDLRNVFLFGVAAMVALGLLAVVGVPTGILKISLRDTMLVDFAGLVVAVAGLAGLRLKWPLTRLAWGAIVAWTFILTLAIHLTGGPQTPMPAMYVLIAVAASFLLGRRGALIVAGLGLFSYAVILALEYSGLLAIVPIWNMPFEPRGRELLLMVNLVTVAAPTLVAALLTGTQAERLADRTRQSDELRQQVSERLMDAQQANRQLRALQNSLSTFQSVLSLNETFNSIATAVCWLGYTAAYIATYEEQCECLSVRASASTMASEAVRASEALAGQSLAKATFSCVDGTNIGVRSFKSGEVLVSQNLHDFYRPLVSPEVAREIANMIRFGCGVSVPLRVERRAVGNLFALTSRPSVAQDDLNMLQAFADQAGAALERAQLFAEIQRGRDRMQVILNSTRDGIMMFEGDGRLMMVNPAAAELLDVGLDDLMGNLFSDVLVYLKTRAGLKDANALPDLEVAFADPNAVSARCTFEMLAPSHRYLELMSWPVLEQGESMAGRLAVLHDVTHQKELEAAREELVHMLVHDLRGPLSSIIAGMYLAQETVKSEDLNTAMYSVNLALEGAERLLELINSLLDVYKLEAGQMKLELSPTELPKLLAESVRPFESAARSDTIDLTTWVESDVPVVAVDSKILQRVLSNLVDNALKFTPQGGRVAVRAELAGDNAVQVSVKDSGPGIPPEARDRIFDKFSQVEGREGKRRGTGLGLNFCQLAVEAHGGRIWVDCPPEGGSVFTFLLPIHATVTKEDKPV